METRVKVVCAIVGFLGILSAALAVAGEATKVTVLLSLFLSISIYICGRVCGFFNQKDLKVPCFTKIDFVGCLKFFAPFFWVFRISKEIAFLPL